MKVLSKVLLVVGLLMMLYAVFSRFYGEPSIAMRYFRSLSFLIFANTMLALSIITKLNSK